jgi:hypothetical protein
VKYVVSTGDSEKSGPGKTVPPGTYAWKCVTADEKLAQSGFAMIQVELLVQVPGRSEPIKMRHYLSASPRAGWVIKQWCNAVGVDYESGDLSVDDCVGATGKADFVLGDADEKGNKYLRVKKVHPQDGVEVTPKATPAPAPAETSSNTKVVWNEEDVPF